MKQLVGVDDRQWRNAGIDLLALHVRIHQDDPFVNTLSVLAKLHVREGVGSPEPNEIGVELPELGVALPEIGVALPACLAVNRKTAPQELRHPLSYRFYENANKAISRSRPTNMSLELKQVQKSYREPTGGVLHVLNVERFHLEQGEQIALVGESGGGKTTLLNVISGISNPDRGKVIIGGHNLTAMPEAVRDRFRAERIGFVFQMFNLLPAFSALENVLLGMSFSGKADKSRATELLERVGLKARMLHRPPQLSVGEQQRVAVARALANSPSLLLADEPTASVDLANQENVLKLIRDGCSENNVSLLLVTHSTEVASLFDRVEKLSDFNKPELLDGKGVSE